jgi:hypothetical protein
MDAKQRVAAPRDRPSGDFGCPQRLSGSKQAGLGQRSERAVLCTALLYSGPASIFRVRGRATVRLTAN